MAVEAERDAIVYRVGSAIACRNDVMQLHFGAGRFEAEAASPRALDKGIVSYSRGKRHKWCAEGGIDL